jgi:hypothetical protein
MMNSPAGFSGKWKTFYLVLDLGDLEIPDVSQFTDL